MAKTVLVTGGTVFVSRYIAEYYVSKGFEVYVLNRNTRLQSPKVKLIQADRHNLGNALRDIHFHVIIDTAYTAADVNMLLDGLRSFDEYILISSSAVYPESAIQPFAENAELGLNKFWGKYGIDKIEAEKALFSRNPNAYVLRPPNLYGKMNNIYREAFIFDCALANRKFYLPKDGSMKLQFFHVEDLCRFIHIIIERKPENHIFNVGNKQAISIREWAAFCYYAVGKAVTYETVFDDIEQRKYFPFYDYAYYLDVTKQHEIMPDEKNIIEGLKEAAVWYMNHQNDVMKKPLIEYIDGNL